MAKKTNIVDNTREGDITGILLGLNLHRLFLLGDFNGEDGENLSIVWIFNKDV